MKQALIISLICAALLTVVSDVIRQKEPNFINGQILNQMTHSHLAECLQHSAQPTQMDE